MPLPGLTHRCARRSARVVRKGSVRRKRLSIPGVVRWRDGLGEERLPCVRGRRRGGLAAPAERHRAESARFASTAVRRLQRALCALRFAGPGRCIPEVTFGSGVPKGVSAVSAARLPPRARPPQVALQQGPIQRASVTSPSGSNPAGTAARAARNGARSPLDQIST